MVIENTQNKTEASASHPYYGDQDRNIMINSNSLESVPSIGGDVCTK